MKELLNDKIGKTIEIMFDIVKMLNKQTRIFFCLKK
jgi:hypothetical protein